MAANDASVESRGGQNRHSFMIPISLQPSAHKYVPIVQQTGEVEGGVHKTGILPIDDARDAAAIRVKENVLSAQVSMNEHRLERAPLAQEFLPPRGHPYRDVRRQQPQDLGTHLAVELFVLSQLTRGLKGWHSQGPRLVKGRLRTADKKADRVAAT